jgi:pantoate--beta-alanine ligase
VTTGLVPTMGALHAGHRALLRAARAENERVVMSLFVNPAQFGPGEDYDRYPRDEQRDREIADAEGVDEVYAPTVEEMYPPGFATRVVSDLGARLEGAARPGHFDGVATVVLKLLLRIAPARVYFGQKDAQQLAVVRCMVRDLNVPVEIRAVPTEREPDGLALSSRNVYLDAEERRRAASLHRALVAGDPALVDGELEYFETVDPDTFAPRHPEPGALRVAAARFGGTRLIDNVMIGES